MSGPRVEPRWREFEAVRYAPDRRAPLSAEATQWSHAVGQDASRVSTVVVVADDLLGRQAIAEFVGELDGVRLELFGGGRDAWEWCAGNEPDLVITDYEMPGLDGISLVTELRRLPHMTGVPIVVVTTGNDPELSYQALEAGANDHLVKPLSGREVRARTRNMLAVRTGYRAMFQRAEWLAGEVEVATRALEEREEEAILSLSRALEHRDSPGGSHTVRIAHSSRIIGATLGLNRVQQQMLFLAAPLHDIGKVGVPDHILLKPGRLSDSEFQVMKLHTVIGHEILAACRTPLLRAAADIALNHHERWDGTGYPSGKIGEEIPIPSRIVAVADVLDALMSTRPYKQGWEWDAAMAHVTDGARESFAPEVIDAVLRAADDLQGVQEFFKD